MKTPEEWIPVYRSELPHRVAIAKAVLADSGIVSMELNKKDSTYIILGEIELYVRPEDAALAKIIIEQNQL
jgi:hypothetical protein